MGAREGIENQLYRYAWAFDYDELDLMPDVFARDAEVEFSTGWQRGRDACVTELARRRDLYRPRNATPWHVITNIWILEESAERAVVRSFYTVYSKEDDGPMLRSLGHYDDVWIVEDGAWRVSWRRVLDAPRR